MDLSNLIGTDPQIVWARRLRREGLDDAARDIHETKAAMAQLIGDELERAEHVLAELEMFHAWLARQQSAASFIDNRTTYTPSVVKNARDQLVLDFKGKHHLRHILTGFWVAYSRMNLL